MPTRKRDGPVIRELRGMARFAGAIKIRRRGHHHVAVFEQGPGLERAILQAAGPERHIDPILDQVHVPLGDEDADADAGVLLQETLWPSPFTRW